MRFLNRRNLFRAVTFVGLVVLSGIVALLIYLNSSTFNEKARQYILAQIQTQTGATASLDRVRWSLLQQRFLMEGLIILGVEPPGSAPLVQIESIAAGVHLRSLLQRRVTLSELKVSRPIFRLLVDSEGKTNLPNPPTRGPMGTWDALVSIDNFTVSGGQAFINDRRVNLDFTVSNLVSELSYRGATRILSMDVGFDGTLKLKGKAAIPYQLSANADYTRGTIVAHRVDVKSGKSAVKLQGRVDDVFTRNLLGRMDYKGTAEVPFLKYFYPNEQLAGMADISGALEFARGYFFTKGNTASKSITFEDWQAEGVKAEYSYHYPGKRLILRQLVANTTDGSISGSVAVEPLPGEPRVNLDLQYQNIDAAELARVYPWDPKYRIYSRMTGDLRGWFEGRFDRFELGGKVNLSAYPPEPTPGVIALPIDGSTEYDARPGQVQVTNADGRFFSTSIQASGLINETSANLALNARSSDLANLFFLYPNANGAGTFSGTLTGPLKTPVLEGAVVLDRHKHREWIIEHADGGVRLDMRTEDAALRNMQVTLGQSQVTLNGSAKIDGSAVDLRIRAKGVRGEDLSSLIKQKVAGTFSGDDVRVTSLNPLRVAGRVSADGVNFEGRTLGHIEADLKYDHPSVDLQKLRVLERDATVTGNLNYNLDTEALGFRLLVDSVDLAKLRDLGVPETLQGTLDQADLEGSGTLQRPIISGNAVVQNLSFYGETFPKAQLSLETNWPILTVALKEARNVDLKADINVSSKGYPFEATANFKNYSLERLAGFNQGTLVVTGNAKLGGLLTQTSGLTGNGTIDAAQIRIRDYPLEITPPLSFKFDSERLTLSKFPLKTGLGTVIDIEGTVGLTKTANLDLTADGDLDLAVLNPSESEWSVKGILGLKGHIGGTLNSPDLSGTANITNGSIGRPGLFTTLDALNGAVVFRGNRVSLENLRGSVGGGRINVQGGGVLRNAQIEAMDIRVETDDVRLRYPEGFTTVVDGTLVLRGSWTSPLLEGNLQIQSLRYRDEFEEFLALLQSRALETGGSALDRLRLAVHVTGNRNINLRNQLADVNAQLDIDIKGTVGNPAIIGHVEVGGGSLFLQGRRYEITRGNILFVDPNSIDPRIDIQAESEIRDYRVILSVVGRGANPRITFRSDPALPELEIVSLIAGGKTREELVTESGVAALPTSEQLFQSGAVSILFDQLRSKVGGGRFGLLGLDRVRIDPYLAGTRGTNPSARITLSEQLTKSLSVTYSQDLGADQERIILIEYFLSKNLSIVASREENNETTALGLDIQFRKRF